MSGFAYLPATSTRRKISEGGASAFPATAEEDGSEALKCRLCGIVPIVQQRSPRIKTGLTRGLCKPCYGRAVYLGNVDEVGAPLRSSTRPIGSRLVDTNGYIKIQTESGVQLEHRVVMEQALGRALLSMENVHHLNGDRADNRMENLELWASPQPYGQRVEQLIAYVAEFHREAILEALEEAA